MLPSAEAQWRKDMVRPGSHWRFMLRVLRSAKTHRTQRARGGDGLLRGPHARAVDDRRGLGARALQVAPRRRRRARGRGRDRRRGDDAHGPRAGRHGHRALRARAAAAGQRRRRARRPAHRLVAVQPPLRVDRPRAGHDLRRGGQPHDVRRADARARLRARLRRARRGHRGDDDRRAARRSRRGPARSWLGLGEVYTFVWSVLRWPTLLARRRRVPRCASTASRPNVARAGATSSPARWSARRCGSSPRRSSGSRPRSSLRPDRRQRRPDGRHHQPVGQRRGRHRPVGLPGERRDPARRRGQRAPAPPPRRARPPSRASSPGSGRELLDVEGWPVGTIDHLVLDQRDGRVALDGRV